ncbi:hypothetical protein AN960_20045 [Bacillus sp. FJAT-25509]|uniref:hypothetical protein n=1 Tax=Bacillaceae TaxID=186817 RepID=UPI0006FCA6B6|nr:hypothetical protein [Bacillus sp. FJAT-25509]KQL33936.1 hypothetical protein AN960_20045 [Bacillus sp. FJAT-25509]
MDEQFIPRKERHKKRFIRKRQNIEREKIKFSTYILSVFYYFLLFLIFNLVQFYIFQHFNHTIKSVGHFDLARAIISGLIYLLCIICIEDTYRRYRIPSTFIRILLPILVFILAIITMYTLIKVFY